MTSYVLFYESADDVAGKAPVHLLAHRERCQEFHARGTLLLVGTFADPQADGSMAVFTTREAAQEFADGDPFVLNGVVRRWEIREWREALQPSPEQPLETRAEPIAIAREIRIAASPDTVWEFLVEPEKAIRWMGLSATLDPRPGGIYRVEVIPGNVARGEFVEVNAPHRLVFSSGWEPGGASSLAPASSTVEIELVADGGGTTLRLGHLGIRRLEDVEAHAHGWDHYLARLAIAAAGGDPGPDPLLSRAAQ